VTQQQFKTCFDTYFDTIRNYMYFKSGDEALATDITQDVFMKVWEKQLDVSSDAVKGLLYKMASNSYVSHIRKSIVATNYMNSIDLNLESNSPEEEVYYKELKEKYDKTLKELTEGQREVFLMSRMEQLSYKEIALRLNLSVKAIEKRMSGALALLKERILHEETLR
jgi:RNA polymerase sigma-70 factor (family 1)